MVLCQAGSTKVAQCGAGTFCGPGWDVCSPSEFLARGGETIAATTPAWINGQSVVEEKQYTAPKDQASCSNATSSGSYPLTWPCAGGMATTGFWAYIAVAASGQCHRIGVNNTATAAYWDTRQPSAALNATVCCQ